MSNYNNLILFQKIYDFLLWLYPRIEKFPKSYRLIHGKYISTSAIELLLLVIDVNVLPPNERFNKKSELSCKLDELRILLRLSKEKVIEDIIRVAKEQNLLPAESTETPQISIVTDTRALQQSNPEFYKVARNNDLIALFPAHQLIILYNQETSSIINSGSYSTTINGF